MRFFGSNGKPETLNGEPFLHVVAFFTVLAEVKAHNFIVRIDSQTDDGIDDLQDNIASDSGQDPCNQNTCGLVQELMSIPIKQPDGKRPALGILENRIDAAYSENSRQQCTQCTARAMNAKGIQGIIIAEEPLDFGNHEIAYDACEQPNGQRRHWSHKTRSRGHGN